MKRRRNFWLMLSGVALLLLLLLSACGKAGKSEKGGQGEAAATTAKRTYYFVGVVMGHPYWLDTKIGIDYTKKIFGVDINIVGPQDWDVPAQVAALEQTIAKKPAGILIPLFDSEPVPGVKKAMEQGIPVMAIDVTVPDSGASSYVGISQPDAGITAAKLLVKYAGNSGKVGVVYSYGLANVEERIVYFTDYLKKNTKWQIVAKIDDKADSQAAIQAATAMFNAHPDLNAACGFDSSAGTGISVAMGNLGIDPNKITVICNDREDTLLEGIQKGTIKATIVAKSALSPYLAVAMLEDHYRKLEKGIGDVPISVDNAKAGVTGFPSDMIIGFAIITKDNVDYYLREKMPKVQ